MVSRHEPDRPSLEERAARAKYELGPDAEKPGGELLPWGYARDRIGAVMVDPERLFLYWEVTDEGIEAARQRLGDQAPAGAVAQQRTAGAPDQSEEPPLWLRIYETTGRIFDGTNPLSAIDIPVDRQQRQWFVTLEKPASDYCVEVGVRSPSGQFARIARSKRVELPRREPWPEAAESWVRVEPAAEGGLCTVPLSGAEPALPGLGAVAGSGAPGDPWAGGAAGDPGARTAGRHSPPSSFAGASRIGSPSRQPPPWGASGSG